MNDKEKQFIKDMTDAAILKDLRVNDRLVDSTKRIKNTYELNIYKDKNIKK